MRFSCFPSFVILLPGETNSSAPDKHYFCNRAIYSKPATEAMPDMPGRRLYAEAGERTAVQTAVRVFAELDFRSRRVYK
jgi:hypothetical protein